MCPVSICRFDHYIICFFYQLRIFDDRLILVTHISGKYDLFRNFSFCYPHFNTCGSQKMPYIIKSDFYSVTQCNLLTVIHRCQKLGRRICICNRINRFVFRFPASSCLPVSPFRLKFLNMGTVTQHDIAQICRCKCCNDLSGKSLFNQ